MRQEERRARTLAALLTAARDGFARGGYDGTSLDAIATEAGVSKGAVYAYYTTKLELFVAVTDDTLADARRRMRRVAAGVGRGEPPQRAAQRYLGDRDDARHVSVVAEIWRMAAVEPDVHERLDGFRRERATDLGRHGVDAGLDPGDAIEKAQMVAKLIDAETLDRRLDVATEAQANKTPAA